MKKSYVSKKVGLSPGTLIYMGDGKKDEVVLNTINYDKDKFVEKKIEVVEDFFKLNENQINWLDIDGLSDISILDKLGNHFNIHSLILEDILNTRQRPKLEELEHYVFLVLKMLNYNDKTDKIESEQVSFILGENYLISFQEKIGDLFEPVRERIRKDKGRIKKMKVDYLLYALIDVIIDNYFVILEKIGEKIETLEEELITNPTPDTLNSIYSLKREMIMLRKSVWPLRDVISKMDEDNSHLFKKKTQVYLKDLYDHTIQVIDTIETFRDMISGMLDLYLSSISNRMNEVMKVLTIISTIFIPMTFLAGIYGMNFEFMPELKWKYAYFGVWGLIILIGLIMLNYFRKKKWL